MHSLFLKYKEDEMRVKLESYCNYHGVSNVLGIRITPIGSIEKLPLQRHIEFPSTEVDAEYIIRALNVFLDAVKKDLNLFKEHEDASKDNQNRP